LQRQPHSFLRRARAQAEAHYYSILQERDCSFVPLVGSYKLAHFAAADACELRDTLLKTHSPVMVRRILTTLSGIFADAKERGKHGGDNPVANMRRRHAKSTERKSSCDKRRLRVGVDIPTPQEVAAIINNASPHDRTLFMVAAFAGLRASELRGLRWGNVDFTKNEITVCERADKFSEMGATKSRSGHRAAALPRALVTALKEQRLRTHGEYVFPSVRGCILSLTEIVRALKAAGVVSKDGSAKYTGMHTLRHFHASWCIARGGDAASDLPNWTFRSALHLAEGPAFAVPRGLLAAIVSLPFFLDR